MSETHPNSANTIIVRMTNIWQFELADNKRLVGTESAPGPAYHSMQSVVDFAVESKLSANAPSVDTLLDPQLTRDGR